MNSKQTIETRTKTTAIHRGATGNIAMFAPRFIQGRLDGFEKDMTICLTPTKHASASGITHAYLPALAACCGLLEYLAGLYRGNLEKNGWQQVAKFAKRYLPQPDFDEETVRILFQVFRHPIAHRGIASGIWVDPNDGPGKGRRITWQVSADTKRPACEVAAKAGQLTRDPPWTCSYTHCGHIHLRSLWIDIRNAADRYSKEIAVDQQLLESFATCMNRLYPP
jgi:hypothetical protein